MRQRGVLLIIGGLLSAILAAILVYYLSTSSVNREPVVPPTTVAIATALPTATPIPTMQVVLAARDLNIRDVVTRTDVVTRNYPVGLAPADAVRVITDVLNLPATTRIFAGEVLLARQFAQAGDVGGGTSSSLPAGKALIAFPATDMIEATGAVHAGDHIDILLTLPVSGTTALSSGQTPEQQAAGARTKVVQATMQDIEVWSSGTWTPQGPTGTSTNETGNGQPIQVFTFVVDHQEALILKYIKDSGGTIDVIVRSLADTRPVATDPVSLDYLVDLYHFALPAP